MCSKEDFCLSHLEISFIIHYLVSPAPSQSFHVELMAQLAGKMKLLILSQPWSLLTAAQPRLKTIYLLGARQVCCSQV